MKRERAQRQPACFPVWSSVDKLDSKLLTQLDLAISSGFPPRCTHDTPLCLMTNLAFSVRGRTSQPSAVQYMYKATALRLRTQVSWGFRSNEDTSHVGGQPHQIQHAEASPGRHGPSFQDIIALRAVPQRLRTRESPHAEVKDSLRILFLFIHPLSRPALVHGPPAPHSRHACPSLASVRFLPACGSAHARFEAVRRRVHL